MRVWTCGLVALALAAEARAQEFQEYLDLAAFFEASTEFVGDERAGEPDMKSFLEHFDAFEELGIPGGGDDGRFFKEGKYRYDLVLADKAYLAWAKERNLDPKAWLRKTVRIMTLDAKDGMEPAVAEAEKMIAEASMGKEPSRRVAELAAALKRLAKAFKAIPAKTEDEAKLFKKYEKELDFVTGSGEEEGCGEGEEEEGCGEEKEDGAGK